MTPEARLIPSRDDVLKAADPFAHFGLDTLLSGAARLRPDTVALADRDETLTSAAFASRATALGHLLAEHGLRRGERIILIGGACNALVVALIAALRAGLEPALAPIDLSGGELSAYARAINAAALIGTTSYGDFTTDDLYFLAAAEATCVRLVATLGPDEMDGAVDLSGEAIRQHSTSAFYTGLERGKPAAAASAKIFTLRRDEHFAPVMHSQSTLIAAGFDFVAKAKIGRETSVLSTFPPVRFASLVAGPVAALLSGAALYFDGPFDADTFLSACDRAGHAHLIVPALFGADFVQAGLTKSLASLTLVSQMRSNCPVLPVPLEKAECPLIDLYAFEEKAAVPEPRRGAIAQPPAREAHHIGFENSKILAVQAHNASSGAVEFSGAAITEQAL